VSDLILCTRCARHVSSDELQCPFCGAALPPPEQRPKLRAIPRGLSRSRLYALHAAALATGVAAAACGSSESPASSSDASGDRENGDVASGGDVMSSTDSMSSADATSNGDTSSNDVAVQDASHIADATADSGVRDAPAEADRFLPPPPYGCVFPGGCDDVVV